MKSIPFIFKTNKNMTHNCTETVIKRETINRFYGNFTKYIESEFAGRRIINIVPDIIPGGAYQYFIYSEDINTDSI